MKANFKLAITLAIGAATTLAAPAGARTLDPAKPEDALEIMKRTQCGEADGVPAVYYWSGKVYSRVSGEPDRHLFNGEGMNIRQCVRVEDPKRGVGYRQVSREVMFYLDPATNEVLRTWKNPWSGETVDVMQIANDPVNGRPSFPYSADGKPFTISTLRKQGKWLFLPMEVPLFYHNVLAGDFQDYVGNKYHAMEIFDFAMLADEMLDTKYPTAYPTISWVRISDWMPWMKMRGRQGQMVFNAMGAKLKKYDDLPKVIKDEIALNHPEYTAPPPGDDPRPNETTWTVFKKMIDAERAAAADEK
ncbi:DUF1838 family protein [Sphingorhabdus sp. 109]|jgi:hypothetical protein|uniref:DUF1838 family protein n=1 Tax=Sphingorhabdus sp. 109 TaxID=2653173 RepID=UPI0012F43562|nr:DUF1838 family protein [Sphingorhabdus sp. 109]VWX59781.1 conserved exported hypothetical protein [Sphingorhabdus sp. 109]